MPHLLKQRNSGMNPYAPLPEKPYLRTAEVANAFGVTPSSVFTWVKNGRLKPIRTPGGNFRFARADVEKQVGRRALTPQPES